MNSNMLFTLLRKEMCGVRLCVLHSNFEKCYGFSYNLVRTSCHWRLPLPSYILLCGTTNPSFQGHSFSLPSSLNGVSVFNLCSIQS